MERRLDWLGWCKVMFAQACNFIFVIFETESLPVHFSLRLSFCNDTEVAVTKYTFK